MTNTRRSYIKEEDDMLIAETMKIQGRIGAKAFQNIADDINLNFHGAEPIRTAHGLRLRLISLRKSVKDIWLDKPDIKEARKLIPSTVALKTERLAVEAGMTNIKVIMCSLNAAVQDLLERYCAQKKELMQLQAIRDAIRKYDSE